MPFAERLPLASVGTLPDVEPDPEVPEPGLGQTLESAFRVNNTLVSALSARTERRAEFLEDYDPFLEIQGTRYEEFADAFADVRDPVDAERVRARIDRELQDRATLAQAGGVGVLASIAAGILDPIVLLPVGGGAAAGGSLLRAGARTAAAGFVGSTAAEVALHQSQDTRTLGESAINVSAATLLSGLLGGALGKLSNAQRASAQRDIEAVIGGGLGSEDVRIPADDVARAADGDPEPLKLRIANSLGAARASAVLKASPSVEILVNSGAESSRRAVATLADLPFALEGDVAVPLSAESITKSFDGMRGELVRAGHVAYRNYRRRIAGKAPIDFESRADFRNRTTNALGVLSDLTKRRTQRPLSRKKFMESVGEIVRNGGRKRFFGDPDEAVELATRYGKSIDDVKEMAVKLGLLPEGVKVETAAAYLTRLYKAELLRQDPGDGFREITATWFQQQHPELSRIDALSAADDVKQNILGVPGGRILYEPVEFKKAAPLKARVFDIPDANIREFLEQDIEEVFGHYIRTMAPDIALARVFPVAEGSTGSPGNFAATQAYKEIVEEYQEKIAAAAPEKRSALYTRRDTDLRKIQQMWNLLRGVDVAGSAIPPDALSRRISRGVRQTTYLALGGAFTVNSLTDVARIVMTQGLSRTMRHALVPLVTDLRGTKLVKQELEQAAAIFETLLDTRARSMVDIGDEFRAGTKFERGLSATANHFSLVNLLSPWTTMTKQLDGMALHQRIAEVAGEIGAGGGRPRDTRYLAQLGISRDMAARIAAQIEAHSETTRSLIVSNTHRWTDAEAVEAFRIALRRGVDQAIVTPGIGDRPIPLVSTEWGKLMTQFRSFQFATVNRALIPMMQNLRHFDVATLNGLMLQVALGAMVYGLVSKARGKEIPAASTDEGMQRWIAEAIDRSGVMGFYSDVNNIAEVLSRGTIGINAVFGGPVLSRYASRNYLGAIFGPQVSRMEDIANLTGALSTGEATQADVRALRRLIPYQNVYYLDRLFDHAETAMLESLGLPAERKRANR